MPRRRGAVPAERIRRPIHGRGLRLRPGPDHRSSRRAPKYEPVPLEGRQLGLAPGPLRRLSSSPARAGRSCSPPGPRVRQRVPDATLRVVGPLRAEWPIPEGVEWLGRLRDDEALGELYSGFGRLRDALAIRAVGPGLSRGDGAWHLLHLRRFRRPAGGRARRGVGPERADLRPRRSGRGARRDPRGRGSAPSAWAGGVGSRSTTHQTWDRVAARIAPRAGGDRGAELDPAGP